MIFLASEGNLERTYVSKKHPPSDKINHLHPFFLQASESAPDSESGSCHWPICVVHAVTKNPKRPSQAALSAAAALAALQDVQRLAALSLLLE